MEEMNTIKRDVYVLRNTIKIPIEVTKGTDAISFEFTVRDYNLPVTAAAVAYAYHKSMKKPNSTLCDVANNVISFQPSANFFEVGNNELQIRVINEDKSLISFKEKVKCSDSMGFPDEEEEADKSLIEQIIAQSGKESGERKAADEKERSERKTADETEKSERQKEIATERARIDQLTKMGEGSTTGDAELADIRVGNEGATYSNAGNAVRAQTKDVPTMMDNLQSPYVDISLLERGSISNAGAEITSSEVLRSVEFHWNKNGKITAPSGYKIAIANYAMLPDESGQMLRVYQSATDYGDSQTSSKADGDAESRRLLIKRSDGADINVEDLRGKITTNVPELRLMDVIESLKKEIKSISDDVSAVKNDLELEPDKIVNMHVWEKLSSELTPNLAAEKALSLGTWPTGVAGLKPDFTINYSDAIGKANGEVVLADPVKTYHVTDSSDYKNLNFLRGKYIKKTSGNEGVFKVMTNATFNVVTEEGTMMDVYAMKCYNAQHVDSAGYTTSYGHVMSASRSAYPDSGLQNEYRYEYRGTIGQALTKVSTISN
ncbi:MAG: hypothetical protein MSS14_01975 [Mediterraneibacter faecis]|nr:hypothetical protein [Mediterraneibacter faecis]MCI7721698.1 hypothetical protein [Mediterraneibacter faecis]